MTLIPDVPLVVVVVHVAALVALLTHTVVANRQRLVLLRQNRSDVHDTRQR